MVRVDVAIVGAGPAGGMAAFELARQGVHTAIVERHRLPRPKACGGAMPLRAFDALPSATRRCIEGTAATGRLSFDFTTPVTPPLAMASGAMAFVDRATFDAALVETAAASGPVELFDDCPVRSVEEDAAGVTLRFGDDVLRARYLIAADGANGVVARQLGIGQVVRGAAAIDAEVEVTDDVLAANRTPRFDMLVVPSGYGWVFPKAGSLSCGVLTSLPLQDLAARLDAYLGRVFPPGSVRSVRRLAHPIPRFAGRRSVASARTCLVGDAAHLVEPLWGEGIAYALRSGQAAATVIAGLLQDDESGEAADCRRYQQIIDEGIGRELEVIHRFGSDALAYMPEVFYEVMLLERAGLAELHRRTFPMLAAFGLTRFNPAVASRSRIPHDAGPATWPAVAQGA